MVKAEGVHKRGHALGRFMTDPTNTLGEAAGGDEFDPPIAQVGAALERGDLAAALAAFGQLPEASRAAGAPWADAAKARAAAAKAASALRAEAISGLAAAKD